MNYAQQFLPLAMAAEDMVLTDLILRHQLEYCYFFP